MNKKILRAKILAEPDVPVEIGPLRDGLFNEMNPLRISGEKVAWLADTRHLVYLKGALFRNEAIALRDWLNRAISEQGEKQS